MNVPCFDHCIARRKLPEITSFPEALLFDTLTYHYFFFEVHVKFTLRSLNSNSDTRLLNLIKQPSFYKLQAVGYMPWAEKHIVLYFELPQILLYIYPDYSNMEACKAHLFIFTHM